MNQILEEAIEGLRGYCKPWEQGGQGPCTLCDNIKIVLSEVKRLQTWKGLMEVLDRHYPADIFPGTSTHEGPRIVALCREVDRLQGIVDKLPGMTDTVD